MGTGILCQMSRMRLVMGAFVTGYFQREGRVVMMKGRNKYHRQDNRQ